MAISVTARHQMYLAYFGRPADADGMTFYAAPHWDVFSVAAAFSASPESVALYGSGTFGEEQIHLIYQNLFNRNAEPAGLSYWLGEINSGRLTPAFAAFGILNGAQNEDKVCVENKMQIATAFFAAMNTDAEKEGYNGPTSIAAVRAYLATVDETPTSVTAANTALPQAVAQATGVLPTTDRFTEQIDNIVGTDNADQFFAQVGESPATLNAGDILDARGGADSLHLEIRSSQGTDPFPSLQARNLEAVDIRNFSGAHVVIDAAGFDGDVKFTTSVAGTKGLEVRNLTAEHEVAMQSASTLAGDSGFVFADGVVQAQLIVQDGFGSTISLGGDDVTRSQVVFQGSGTQARQHIIGGLAFTGSNHGDIRFMGGIDQVEIASLRVEGQDAELTITGDTASAGFKLGAIEGALSLIDAGGFAGGVEVTDTGGFDFIGGKGDDSFHVDGATTGTQIAGGSGTDTLVVLDGTAIGTAVFTGFESVVVTNGVTLDVSKLGAQVQEVVIDDRHGATSVTGLSAAQADSVVIRSANGSSGNGALSIGLANVSGADTRLTLHIEAAVLTSQQVLGKLNIAGLETLRIEAEGSYSLSELQDAGELRRFEAAGDGKATITTGMVNFAADAVFDFSEATGTVAFSAIGAQQGATASGLRILDGQGGGSITGSGKSDNVTYAGGADTIQLGAGGDIFDFGGKEGSNAMGAEGVTFIISASTTRAGAGAVQGQAFTAAAYDAAVTDRIEGIDNGSLYAPTAGTLFRLSTTNGFASLATGPGSALVFGTTTVAQPRGAFVVMDAATNSAFVFQDTGGGANGVANGVIDATDMMIRLVGNTDFAGGEFQLSAGEIVFRSQAG